MKKLLFSLFIFFSFTALTGQNDELRRVEIGVIFSPDYCYRTLKGDKDNFIYNGREEREIAKFGFTSGLNICFNLNPVWGIESGLQYANKGYQSKKTYMNDSSDPVLMAIGWNKNIYQYHYLELPLKARITVGQGRVRFSSGFGLITGLLIKETYIVQDKEGKYRESHTPHGRRINLSPAISAGVDYRLTSRSRIRIEPTFQYGLLNLNNSEASLKEYLWSAGLNISYLIWIK